VQRPVADEQAEQLLEQLRAAVEEFEALLPTDAGRIDSGWAGPWPKLTPDVRAALRQVREAAESAVPVPRTRWPRRTCLGCAGHGWFLIDPEIDPDVQACRRCLATGLLLHSTS
jgi:hypothetical protein